MAVSLFCRLSEAHPQAIATLHIQCCTKESTQPQHSQWPNICLSNSVNPTGGEFFETIPRTQQLVSDTDLSPRESQKQQQISKREESVKEKIILTQEKNIQRLNELVLRLREQLEQCRSNNETMNGTLSSLTENVIELERQQILDD
ncbi:Uncharacterized protein Fot_17489 [Forsythia ovata]|uniref:Uncharacterized protein n=1 Tax=Forsythia ovata TaxID=205694 RepID=A0ABD1VFL3_9LAMI